MWKLDKELDLQPLTAADACEWERWVRTRTIGEAEARIALLHRHGVIDVHERRRILDDAMAKVDSGQASKYWLMRDEGAAYMLYLHLRRHDAELTPEQAGNLFLSTERGKVMATLDKVNGHGGNSAPPSAAGNEQYGDWVDLTPTKRGPGVPVPGAGLPADEQRRAVFDRMCSENGITPQALVDMPIDEASSLYKNVTGSNGVNNIKLKKYLYEYAEAAKAAGAPVPEAKVE